MILLRKLAELIQKEGVVVFLYIGGLLAFTLMLMPVLEGPDSPYANIWDNFWWFMVTITTVGYGDISPSTLGGKMFAVVVMLSGIGLAAGLITYVSSAIIERRKHFLKGLKTLKVSDHIAILGYDPNSFYSLMEEIFADDAQAGRPVVLCTDAIDENPYPQKIRFVKGAITSDDVLERACISDARSVIIHGSNDQENILATLAVRNVNKNNHIVTFIANPENIKHIKRISSEISIVNPIYVPLIVQEMQDAGTLEVVSELLSNNTGSEIYRIDMPNEIGSRKFIDLFKWFKNQFQATIIGVKGSSLILNPTNQMQVEAGSALFLIAEDRPRGIDWSRL